ncbi:MAG: hypothetical protein C5B57_05630 [Blastocatellia bacterium]|nr:MAG: hypothetical protein C5B57_05630 [Blastocatellia bacterium]
MIINFPILLLVLSFVAFVLSVMIGDALRRRTEASSERGPDDFGVVLTATLTLLGLIIGFSFSMATSRYDLRRSNELIETNAIATQYVRSDLLPAAEATRARELLKEYLDRRITYYTTRNEKQLAEIAGETAQVQTALWSVIRTAIPSVPPPLEGLVVSGLNDIANSERSTRAAWENRIPFSAWILIAAISLGCNVMLGFRAHRRDWLVFLVLPAAVSVSLFLIADLDSPRGGVIRVAPQNLIGLSHSLPAQLASKPRD